MSDSSTSDELKDLQALILGHEKERLHKLDRRVSDLESRTTDVAEVLPGAMNRLIDDPVASPELEQPIAHAIRGAIKRDTESFAEALFPILGPAIRLSIADALSSLVQRINVALEHSFTVKGLRWRLEAARSGVPFGQVVLRHTMLYAVQESFLIQRESGLVLASVQRDETLALDEDAVSAMLVAIQAFIQDSFGASTDEPLRSAELGDRTLWVINGPDALLACVITGSPPRVLRGELMHVLETLHARFGDLFGEKPESLVDNPGVNALMHQTLNEQSAEDDSGSKSSTREWLWGTVGVVVLLLLAWSIWSGYRYQREAEQLVTLFGSEPGYIVTSRDTVDGQLVLSGLRDPLATPPESLLSESHTGLEDISLNFRPYQSLDDVIVLRRIVATLGDGDSLQYEINGPKLTVKGQLTASQYAQFEALPASHPLIRSVDLNQTQLTADEAAILIRQEIDAPNTVSITPVNGRMVVSGSASAEWYSDLPISAEPIGGWSVDMTPLRGAMARRLSDLINTVNGRTIWFSRATQVATRSATELDALGSELAEVQQLATALNDDLVIRLQGYSDGVGTAEENQALSMARAGLLRASLGERGVNAANIAVTHGAWNSGVADPSQRKVVVLIHREPAS